jgi:predicted MPP superfamily phosphohydrolase
MKKDLIIALGDMHCPFLHWPCFIFALDFIKANKQRIKAIIQLGDLYDLFSYSKFPKRLIMTPRQECFEARSQAEEVWELINKAAPRAKKYQLLGNHDERLAKRVVENMPELDHLVKYNEIYEFKGVKTIQSAKEDLIIDNWHFTHGHTKEGNHIQAVDFNNVCLGHTHRGGTWSKRLHRRKDPKILTELNAGFMGDPFHDALIYRPMMRYFTWTWGFAVIDNFGGRFIPFTKGVK